MHARKKILVIEDEKILGEILLTKLNHEGYDAEWALDGEAGLQALREFKPDFVLLDIVMPKKNGYEVLEEMSKDEKLRKIPVVVISNSGQPVEIERILALGAKDYVVKAQFSPEEVLEKVRKYLDGNEKPDASASSSASRKNVHVLVVEDDAFLSSLVAGQLVKEGYQVSAAHDGKEGWDAMQEKVPDLVLLDIIMPALSGFEVLKKMKADPKLKDVPVIIFSNLVQEQEIEEGHQLGADDFLVKAKFTLREVLNKIQALLEKKGKL